MSFPLSTFRSHLPSDILQKGQDYWNNNAVDDLIETADGYEATVFGTDDYEVYVDVDNGTVEHWSCDCLYDWGPICKHVAAVLFEIEARNQSKVYSSSRMIKLGKNIQKPPLEKILEQLSEVELRKLMLYFAKKDKSIKAHLLTKYANLAGDTGKEHFKNLVKSIIDAHTGGRHGFIEYQEASRLGNKLFDLIYNTKKTLPNGSEIQLVYLCEAIIVQLAKAYQYADDSSGSMGMAMEEAISQLTTLASKESDYPQDLVQYIYEFAMRENSLAEENGDWAYSIRDLVVTAARKQEQIQALINELETVIEQAKNQQANFSSKYRAESAAEMKLELLEDWFSKEEAETFLYKNLQYSKFRTQALEKAMQEKRYDEVAKLANEGIEFDTQRNYAGLVNQWKEWLRKLANATGDKKTLAEMTEKMFLESNRMNYYQELKSQLSKAEWKEKVEQFLKKYRAKERPTYWGPRFNHMVGIILEAEERWDDLMVEIEKNPSLDLLEKYRKYLGKRFSEKYLELYDGHVRSFMENNTGRSIYQNACEYLKVMQNLGGKNRVDKIISDWRATYPRRPAMLEELEKFEKSKK